MSSLSSVTRDRRIIIRFRPSLLPGLVRPVHEVIRPNSDKIILLFFFHSAAMLLFFVLQKKIHRNFVFLKKIFNYTVLYDTFANDASVNSTTQVCLSAMLV